MLDFEWEDDALVIKQCDKMKTNPGACSTCKHRFRCFTERIKTSGEVITSIEAPRLSDLLKKLEKLDGDIKAG